jgi:hypothetical protein
MFRLRMIAFNGMPQVLGEGTWNAMQKKATRYKKRHDGPVNVITPFWEWELEDPGDRMIGDFDGYLKLERVVDDAA